VNLFVFDVDPDVGEVFDLDASLAFGPPSGSYLQFVTFDAADPAQAFFSLFVGSDTLSADGASDIGSDDSLDLMQFLFRNVDGDGIFAPFNKGVILVEFSAPQLLPLSDGFFSGGGQLSVTVLTRVNIGQVPLPAGLPLLLAGIGAFALLRRRRA
jgi:hypothetical protein